MSLDKNHFFFIGIAGSGMSALAQYLRGIGKTVSGSDRFFGTGEANALRDKLEAEGIHCFPQDGSGLGPYTDIVVASTAVEDTVPEVHKARKMNIPVVRRSEMLAMIAASKKTIAVGGTSGKSTTSAMLYDILDHAGLSPSIISGAGLVSLINKGKIGNAAVGKGELLVIEADESDGSIVQYKPAVGLLLNVDKDHKEMDELMDIFRTFRANSERFIVNRSQHHAAGLSLDKDIDFSIDPLFPAGYQANDFHQEGLTINFTVNRVPFRMKTLGRHNMENATAAAATAALLGVPLELSARSLEGYEGIYRRHQVYGQKHGVWLIDDFAHNPVKCAMSIAACQPLAPKVVAWFQPHGYGPTRFLRKDFVQEISAVLRPGDEIWMSEIFYAGGTATKDISAKDLIDDISATGKKAFFVEDRSQALEAMRPHLTEGTVLLLMGARDPSLEDFAGEVWSKL
jgi:UDP-N-acetylmuramate--alanine ligase